MSSRLPPPDRIERSERAVREFLSIALSPIYAGLDAQDVLCEAESVWDNYELGSDTTLLEEGLKEGPVSDLWKVLIRELHAARRDRFGEEQFSIFSLWLDREGGECSLSCDLMWPDSNAIHSMRIFLPQDLPAPKDLN